MSASSVDRRWSPAASSRLVEAVVAAPGSVSGRYPVGNTGRASVGLLEPMLVPDDLAQILSAAGLPAR